MQSIFSFDIDYNRIARYISEHDIKLVIFDFNGLLDDYYTQKLEHLRRILGPGNEHYIPELLLGIERAYMMDRSATLEQSVEAFFRANEITMNADVQQQLKEPFQSSRLTDGARNFLDALDVPFVIYTAMTKEGAQQALGSAKYELFTRDAYQEDKPSIANLKVIVTRHGVQPSEVCVVGDGLIDDLMPASLMGMHTILVSPFAMILANSSVS